MFSCSITLSKDSLLFAFEWDFWRFGIETHLFDSPNQNFYVRRYLCLEGGLILF